MTTKTDRPASRDSEIASEAMEAIERRRSPQPDMDGMDDSPTRPRENPPVDDGRVARAHEDYHRVLGG